MDIFKDARKAGTQRERMCRISSIPIPESDRIQQIQIVRQVHERHTSYHNRGRTDETSGAASKCAEECSGSSIELIAIADALVRIHRAVEF